MNNKKRITVNSIDFEFFFDERLNMWRILENKNVLDGFTLDIEIDLKNFKQKDFEMAQIQSFLEYLHKNKSIIDRNLEDAKKVLLSFFQKLYANVFDKDVLENIDFNFVGIDFKGYSGNYNNMFEYDFQFFPYYIKDTDKDIGTFLWKAMFRNGLLLGVYSDTQ
ncbi:MAG TPA: hypothetical protein PLL00_10135 [Bacteroidia bacterium]|nr:hypothetical protein [Bacteroidia bacterium]